MGSRVIFTACATTALLAVFMTRSANAQAVAPAKLEARQPTGSLVARLQAEAARVENFDAEI